MKRSETADGCSQDPRFWLHRIMNNFELITHAKLLRDRTRIEHSARIRVFKIARELFGFVLKIFEIIVP